MGSGKSGSQSKDYYGNMAWELCAGQLDFIYGLQLDNDLAWPKVDLWDAKVWKKGTSLIYTDGNVYKNAEKTSIDPNAYPWVQIATPWVAGTYHAGDTKLYLGNVWEATATTNVAPPAVATKKQVESQNDTVTNGWKYVCTPQVWSGVASNFWGAGSIVAWEGRLWTTAVATADEPGVGADWTLFKIDRATSPNPLKITVEDSGDWFLYWGTSTQTLDAVEEAVLTAQGHPPYRNKAVLVCKNAKFGTMKTTPPSPVVLGGRAPVQTLIIDNTAVVGVNALALDDDWQSNPWVFLAEVLTNPIYGLGLSNTQLDQASWQAEADRCALNPELYYISPMITSLTKVRELVANILSYPDGFIFWSVVGTLVAGHWPHGEAAPAFDASNTINRNNLSEEIKLGSGRWGDTSSSVEVSFNDWTAGFQSRPVSVPSITNMRVTRRVQSKKIDRPFIVREKQALAWAAEFAKIEAQTTNRGTLTIQAEKASAVKPGQLFKLTDDIVGSSTVNRCTRHVLSAPPRGTRSITFEKERGVASLPYVPTPTNPVEDAGPRPSSILSAQIVQLPSPLSGEENRIACLAGRRDDVTTALDIWFQKADGAAYQNLGRQSAFAVGGAVATTIAAANGYILTTNSVKGTTYGTPTWTTVLDLVVTYIPPGGALTGGLVYGTDYTVNLFTGDVTILNTTAIPNGSQINVTLFDGVVATQSATLGNTYDVPRGFWDYNVYKRAAGAAYTGGLTGSTHLTEGADYLIDPEAGQITIINGGAVNATDAIFILYKHSVVVRLSPTAPQEDIDGISSPPTEDEINDGSILVFAFQKANPNKFEIMSLQSIVAAASQIYLTTNPVTHVIRIMRGQFGTKLGGDGAHVWGQDDILFIIRKSDLVSYSHESFASLAAAEATANFILAPESAWVVAETSDLYDPASNPEGLSVLQSYTFANLFPPTVTILQLLKNGTDFTATGWTTYNFLTTDVISMLLNIDDPNVNLTSVSVSGILGDSQFPIIAQTAQQVSSQTVLVRFSFPRAGQWRLLINAVGLSGNSSVTISPDDGTGAYVGAASPTGTIYQYSVVGSQVVDLQIGLYNVSTYKVFWQVKNRGTPPDAQGAVGGVWTQTTPSATVGGYQATAVGAIPNFATGKTLYVYLTDNGGGNPSETVQFNIDR